MDCDFCPKSPFSGQAIMLCCPQGEYACEKCLYSTINAAYPCGNCQRVIGKKMAFLKRQFIQMGGHQNGVRLENKQGQRMGNYGNYGNTNRMRNMNQVPSLPSMNQMGQMGQHLSWNGNQGFNTPSQQYQYHGYPMNMNEYWMQQNFSNNREQNQFELFKQYQRHLMGQNGGMTCRNFTNYQQPDHGMNQQQPSPQMQHGCLNDEDLTESRREQMQKLMRSASKSIIPPDAMHMQQHESDLSIGNFSVQGSYLNSRVPKTTDNISMSNNDDSNPRMSRSNSVSHFLTKREKN